MSAIVYTPTREAGLEPTSEPYTAQELRAVLADGGPLKFEADGRVLQGDTQVANVIIRPLMVLELMVATQGIDGGGEVDSHRHLGVMVHWVSRIGGRRKRRYTDPEAGVISWMEEFGAEPFDDHQAEMLRTVLAGDNQDLAA